MRDTAFFIIKTAAAEVGLPVTSVIERPWKKVGSILLPDPRMEVEWMGESLKRSGRRLAVVAGSDPLRSRTVRRALYTAELTARCELVSDDPEWVEEAYREYVLALPRKVGDANNDLVVVTANRAVRGGFVSGLVDVGRKRSSAVYVVFRGLISRDESVPWVRDAHIVPYVGGFPRVVRLYLYLEAIPEISWDRLRSAVDTIGAPVAVDAVEGVERSVGRRVDIDRRITGERSRSVADVFAAVALMDIAELTWRSSSEPEHFERPWMGWWSEDTWESRDTAVAWEQHSEW